MDCYGGDVCGGFFWYGGVVVCCYLVGVLVVFGLCVF